MQDLLGHAKLGTTGIYTRLTDPMMREIVLRIPTALDVAEAGEKRVKEQPAGLDPDTEYWGNFVREVIEW